MSQRVPSYQHVPAGAVAFGAGLSASLGEQRPLRKAERVLVVSDAGVRDAGLLERVTKGLGQKVALVDDAVVPDGDAVHIHGLADRARAANVDAIVAVGGGSVLDTAKAVAALLAKGGRLQELEGFATVRSKLLPLVGVPTTAGTGAEATQFVVVADREAGRKIILSDTSLVPTLAVLDPELVVGLPAHITAATAVDALTHAVEAAASRMRNPFGTALAVEAARTITADDGLARCLAEPGDVVARGRLLTAACLAGHAISANMLGACHAFAHALGALKGVPHGVANGLFLVPVMRLNLEKARGAYAHLGLALGGQGDETALAEHAIATVERVVHEVAKIPTRLRAVDVREEDLPRFTQLVLADPDLATNPVQINEASRVEAILRTRL